MFLWPVIGLYAVVECCILQLDEMFYTKLKSLPINKYINMIKQSLMTTAAHCDHRKLYGGAEWLPWHVSSLQEESWIYSVEKKKV